MQQGWTSTPVLGQRVARVERVGGMRVVPQPPEEGQQPWICSGLHSSVQSSVAVRRGQGVPNLVRVQVPEGAVLQVGNEGVTCDSCSMQHLHKPTLVQAVARFAQTIHP